MAESYCYNQRCKQHKVEWDNDNPFFVTEDIGDRGVKAPIDETKGPIARRMITREYFMSRLTGKGVYLCSDCAGLVTAVSGIQPMLRPFSATEFNQEGK